MSRATVSGTSLSPISGGRRSGTSPRMCWRGSTPGVDGELRTPPFPQPAVHEQSHGFGDLAFADLGRKTKRYVAKDVLAWLDARRGRRTKDAAVPSASSP